MTSTPSGILIYPDNRLRVKAREVASITEDVKLRARLLVETLHVSGGVGLAATQMGWDARVIAINVWAPNDLDRTEVFVNPAICHTEGVDVQPEGCLSFPDVTVDVRRSAYINFYATTLDGEVIDLPADGLFARCVQHEIDHLDGKLLIDHVSPAKRLRLEKRLKGRSRHGPGA